MAHGSGLRAERDGPPTGAAPVTLEYLVGPDRERAVPAIRDGFVGIYRWHAKRQLREVTSVRAAVQGGEVVGAALLDRLLPEVGYVYYITVLTAHRRTGVGGRLLDDALERYRHEFAEVVYAAVQSENAPSLRLFVSRGFREVARRELGWREGGLGAWGLRSRMRLVPGERLLGLRLSSRSGASASDDNGKAGEAVPPRGSPWCRK